MLNKKILKNMAFAYNQHIISIIYTNGIFWSIGTTSDFVQNCMNDKIFEKINIKIVIGIQ